MTLSQRQPLPELVITDCNRVAHGVLRVVSKLNEGFHIVMRNFCNVHRSCEDFSSTINNRPRSVDTVAGVILVCVMRLEVCSIESVCAARDAQLNEE